MFDNLIAVILKTTELSQRDIELCKQYFELISVQKNTILEKQDDVPLSIFFIDEGYVRLFYHDESGNEITTLLSAPGQFITHFLSFINRVKSPENVAAVTNCNLLKISVDNLKKLIDESDNFKKFSLIIFEQAISSTSIRANDLATLSAEQRYKKLITQQAHLVQNVPIQYLASYLGMKPESLSRIRRQIIS